jgi:hypothetical protein
MPKFGFTKQCTKIVHEVHSFFPKISGNDCGLFALAFARMLCEYIEPSLVEFNQYTMQYTIHNFNIFEIVFDICHSIITQANSVHAHL